VVDLKKIFLDGEIVKARKDRIEALAPGVVKGYGAFETMGVYNGQIFAWEEHFNRLKRGLACFDIRLPYSKKYFAQCLRDIIRLNGWPRAAIRLSVWREGNRRRTSIISRAACDFSRQEYRKGWAAMISSHRRVKHRYTHIKSMDYRLFRRAFDEAVAHGCDEAILLNNRGELVEGSRTNVFFIKKNILYTPPVYSGCLNGIIRQKVLGYARGIGVLCVIEPWHAEALYKSDEAFLTNSGMGVMPLTVVNGRPVGRGAVGPITDEILNAYFQDVHFSCPPSDKSV